MALWSAPQRPIQQNEHAFCGHEHHHRRRTPCGRPGARTDGRARLGKRLARARGRAAGGLRAGRLRARLLPDPAGRSRRGALRAGDEADVGNRTICRHPVSERGALQKAGRHLLAAGRRRESGPSHRLPASAHHHLALPPAVAVGRNRRGVAHLLGRARLRVAPHLAGGGADDGELDPARRRGAARQDRRDAAVHLRGGDGRHGAHLSRAAARAGAEDTAGASRRSCGPRWPRAC